MAGNGKTLTVRISSELQGKLDLIAGATHQPRSRVVKHALEVYVATEAAQIEEIKHALVEADAGDFASEAEIEAVFQKWCRDRPDAG